MRSPRDLAQGRSVRRRSDSVRYVRYFCRADETTGTAPPSRSTGDRATDRLPAFHCESRIGRLGKRLNATCVLGIELAVDERTDQYFAFDAVHGVVAAFVLRRNSMPNATSIEHVRAATSLSQPALWQLERSPDR